MRMKYDAEKDELDPPRFAYKYNKSQTVQKKDNKGQKKLLYINHLNFIENLIEALVEPVEIINPHLANEAITDYNHKRELEY